MMTNPVGPGTVSDSGHRCHCMGAGVGRALRVGAGLIALALAVGVAGPAAAAGDPLRPRQSANQQPVSTTTVTLLTGDVVQLTTYRDGRQVAAVAPDSPSRPGGFQTVQRDGHSVVIPNQVLPY